MCSKEGGSTEGGAGALSVAEGGSASGDVTCNRSVLEGAARLLWLPPSVPSEKHTCCAPSLALSGRRPRPPTPAWCRAALKVTGKLKEARRRTTDNGGAQQRESSRVHGSSNSQQQGGVHVHYIRLCDVANRSAVPALLLNAQMGIARSIWTRATA